jgi:hypothetical protein
VLVPVIAGLATWEAAWWARRRSRRAAIYQEALHQARELNRPLMVIGAPDGGVTSGYDCGDITVDVCPSSCPVHLQADITQRIPMPDASCVIFVSCVLEYVDDLEGALQEIQRVSGGHAYFVGVEPWTLTAFLYPGAQRRLPAHLR